MKIGIDINNRDISRAVKRELKKKGYYIIDMSLEEERNIGGRIFKKVLLANSANLEFFLSIEMSIGNGNIDVYYKEEVFSKEFSDEIIKRLKSIGFDKVSLNDGKEFYLIKNTKVPTVIIKLNFDDSEIECRKKVLINSIVESIERISFIY